MTLKQISVSREVAKRLGKQGMSEVRAYLWAVDCQTCNRPLGNQSPSLCVDVAGYAGMAVATLHHQACRQSDWSTQGVRRTDAITWLCQCLLLADQQFGGSPKIAEHMGSDRPTIVLNPSAEMVVIERIDTFRWQLSNEFYRDLGLCYLGQDYVVGRAISAGCVTLQPTSVTAHLADSAWDIPIISSFARAVNRYQGITLCVTAALGPENVTEDELFTIITDPRTQFGWLALRQTP